MIAASRSSLPASVAAGHPVTAQAGIDVLRAGGNAADAAVAMMFMTAASEPIFTGLHGGGFATYYEAASGTVTCLDFFVAVPGLGNRSAGAPTHLVINLGGQDIDYIVGAPSIAVPGNPAGGEALHRRFGRLDWADVLAPSIAAAEAGVALTEAHHAVLLNVAPAMIPNEGAAVFLNPDGELRRAGDLLGHPGMVQALKRIATYGSADFYTGEIAQRQLAATADGGLISAEDLAAYQAIERVPRQIEVAGRTLWARGNDLDDILGTVQQLATIPEVHHPSWHPPTARRLVDVLRAVPKHSETTNLVVADAAGNACALTTSLGLGAGLWVPGFGIHMNSMLGESELIREQLQPGDRMGSMMTPMCITDADGLYAAAGAAGGGRIRSGLIQTLIGMLFDDLSAADAVAMPRLNALPTVVRIEPGFSDEVLADLGESEQLLLNEQFNAYFGGVSAIGRSGPGADPRRGGAAMLV